MYHILGCVRHLVPPKRGNKRITQIDAYIDAEAFCDAVEIALRRNDIDPNEEGTTWKWMAVPKITEDAQTP